ncbi:arabinose operon transcriptional regulator AraC [Pasteurella multocida]|uniref:arabinose operon transcriptional regulator AraC n=1 Tax=Pasteurella multocida TaxID=747 RepID=UPI0020204867|nr:arabinose operon transcriptional regulator AraC [Pasteurella multocida]MCL7850598.1 arabinose operon transcriptional regulator AraC [Pasteurella multocida]
MSENTNPLLPNYPFNLELVAGITQIEEGNYLDFTINRPHGMNGYILHLTTLGKGTIFDGQDFFYATKGQLLLFSPQAIHHYHRSKESKFWTHKWVYFYPNSRWGKWLTWSDTRHHIGKIKIQDQKYFNEISKLFSQIEAESQSANTFKEEMALSLLEFLLIKCISAEKQQNTFSIDSRIIAIQNLITQDLSKNWTITELAQQVYLSASRLSHLFFHSTEMSIIQWIERQRVLEIKRLLYFSDRSITALAKSFGYNDPLYFSKVFKKHTGLSPSKFRQQCKNIKLV